MPIKNQPVSTHNLFPLIQSDTNIYRREINKPDLDSEVNDKSTKLNYCKEYEVTITTATVATEM